MPKERLSKKQLKKLAGPVTFAAAIFFCYLFYYLLQLSKRKDHELYDSTAGQVKFSAAGNCVTNHSVMTWGAEAITEFNTTNQTLPWHFNQNGCVNSELNSPVFVFLTQIAHGLLNRLVGNCTGSSRTQAEQSDTVDFPFIPGQKVEVTAQCYQPHDTGAGTGYAILASIAGTLAFSSFCGTFIFLRDYCFLYKNEEQAPIIHPTQVRLFDTSNSANEEAVTAPHFVSIQQKP